MPTLQKEKFFDSGMVDTKLVALINEEIINVDVSTRSNDGFSLVTPKKAKSNKCVKNNGLWHYTYGGIVQIFGNSFILSVGYYRLPEKPVSKTNRHQQARSIDSKFNRHEDIPNTFQSRDEAVIFMTAFRRHVEEVVHGKHEKLSPNVIRDRSESQIREKLCMSHILRRNQVKKKHMSLLTSIQVEKSRREDCQNWRMRYIHILEQHINA